jgi:hypothetical protein
MVLSSNIFTRDHVTAKHELQSPCTAKFKHLLATAADDARWWFLLTYLHGIMLQQSINYSRLVRPKFKQLLATAADDARWWFLLTYLHGVMLQQSMNYSLLARPKFKQASSYGYWRFRNAGPFEPIYTVQRLRVCTRTPFSAPLLTQVILFYRFYEAILDSCRKNLVALGGESCSSCRQPGRGSRVAIHTQLDALQLYLVTNTTYSKMYQHHAATFLIKQ